MKREIRAESFVRKGDELIPVDDLTPEDREGFACWLKETYLNELFRGKGRVTAEKEKT